MNDERTKDRGTGQANRREEKIVSRAIRLAGRRPPVPPARATRMRGAVHAAWRRKIEERDRGRRAWQIAWAAAALVVVALGVGLWRHGPWTGTAVSAIASIESVDPGVRLLSSERAEGRFSFLRRGDELAAGSVIETGTRGRAALRLPSGHSVRLDRETRLVLASASELRVERGAVYVDSGRPGEDEGTVAVHTPFGVAHEIGTQYEVRVTEHTLRVRVREGAVDLEYSEKTETVVAGSEVELDVSGELRREAIPVYGEEWSWVLEIAPPFEIEGRSLAEVLDWAARETGLRVLYSDAATDEEAPTILLRGSSAGLTPLEILEATLPTCDLCFRVEEGTLIVEGSAREAGTP
jgi:ferric-dicitrate binding protein FerR (iron transport regulator)